ncbi:MAG: rRNA maturation RNase YbeY [Candidatus Amoebophilus sp.]
MPKANIYYFVEDIQFKLPNPKIITDWIHNVIQQENCQLVNLNFIFCSDNFLHEKNLKYLQHDTLTDVITFSYAEDQKNIEGEIYISIERVSDNATTYQIDFLQELYTVMIHGVLHLLGYNDETLLEQEEMRKKESIYMLANRIVNLH